MDVYYGHCESHNGTLAELHASSCGSCVEFAKIIDKYEKYRYIRSYVHGDTVRHGFICDCRHEFYVDSKTPSSTCPICEVITFAHVNRHAEVTAEKVRKYNNAIDARSRKITTTSSKVASSSIIVDSLDHGSAIGYKQTMAALESEILDVKPKMFTTVPALKSTVAINTFIREEQLVTDLEYQSGVCYDLFSSIKWKCNRKHHNPRCTNRRCMLLVASGHGVVSRDNTCNDLVPCDCVFVAPVNMMLKQRNALECDIGHRIKLKSGMFEACRIFETIFDASFIENYHSTNGVLTKINPKFRFDGYNHKLKIGFLYGASMYTPFDEYCVANDIKLCRIIGAASDMDKIIIHIIDWIYSIGLQKLVKFENTESLIADIDKKQLTELIRRLLHIYNRRGAWM